MNFYLEVLSLCCSRFPWVVNWGCPRNFCFYSKSPEKPNVLVSRSTRLLSSGLGWLHTALICDRRASLNHRWDSKSKRSLWGMGDFKGVWRVTPLQGWMKSEGCIRSAYEGIWWQSVLVEGMPAGRVFSWCKLSIRSEEPKDKEALCERLDSSPKDKGGRFSQR